MAPTPRPAIAAEANTCTSPSSARPSRNAPSTATDVVAHTSPCGVGTEVAIRGSTDRNVARHFA
jgi:hypothetical protein